MENTIQVKFKDGKMWNIHRSGVEMLAAKSEEEVEQFFSRFWAWFEDREKDVLWNMSRMDREGIQIPSELDIQFR